MTTYKSGDFKLSFYPRNDTVPQEHQRDFMPEDTKAGMIQAYLDRYTGSAVCSKAAFQGSLKPPLDDRNNGKIGRSTTL